MMNEPEVDGMRQEDYSKDWVMHNFVESRSSLRNFYFLES